MRHGRCIADRLAVSASVSDFDSSSDDDQLDRLEQQRDHSISNSITAPSAAAGLEWNSLGDSGGGATASAGTSSGVTRADRTGIGVDSARSGRFDCGLEFECGSNRDGRGRHAQRHAGSGAFG